MANKNCGCTGIRQCFLCESGKLNQERRDINCELQEEGFGYHKKLLHYCLNLKIVVNGAWKECQCFSPYGKIENGGESRYVNDSHNRVDKSVSNEILKLNDEIIVTESFVSMDEDKRLKNEIYKFPWKQSQSGRRKQVMKYSFLLID